MDTCLHVYIARSAYVTRPGTFVDSQSRAFAEANIRQRPSATDYCHVTWRGGDERDLVDDFVAALAGPKITQTLPERYTVVNM